MSIKGRSNNVITLANKIADKKGLELKNRNKKKTSYTRVIAITSGKGGVGKTNIVVNLGFALSRLGKKVIIFDADLGLGNIDVLLGLAPKYNLSHVINGEKTIKEIIVEGPGKMKILPASSGIHQLANLSFEQQEKIFDELNILTEPVDILLIDTAAGISSSVMYFNVSAHDIIVVVSPEPTSITDAYALMKVLSMHYSAKHFKLLVNSAASIQEANEVFRQLHLVVDRFLDITIDYLGYILFDENLKKSVRRQQIVSEILPGSTASECIISLAKTICRSVDPDPPDDKSRLFWKNIFLKKQ